MACRGARRSCATAEINCPAAAIFSVRSSCSRIDCCSCKLQRRGDLICDVLQCSMLIANGVRSNAKVDGNHAQRFALRKHRNEDGGLRQLRIVPAIHHRTLAEVGYVQQGSIPKTERYGRSERSLRLDRRKSEAGSGDSSFGMRSSVFRIRLNRYTSTFDALEQIRQSTFAPCARSHRHCSKTSTSSDSDIMLRMRAPLLGHSMLAHPPNSRRQTTNRIRRYRTWLGGIIQPRSSRTTCVGSSTTTWKPAVVGLHRTVLRGDTGDRVPCRPRCKLRNPGPFQRLNRG